MHKVLYIKLPISWRFRCRFSIQILQAAGGASVISWWQPWQPAHSPQPRLLLLLAPPLHTPGPGGGVGQPRKEPGNGISRCTVGIASVVLSHV
jgi:hypothetical protein